MGEWYPIETADNGTWRGCTEDSWVTWNASTIEEARAIVEAAYI